MTFSHSISYCSPLLPLLSPPSQVYTTLPRSTCPHQVPKNFTLSGFICGTSNVFPTPRAGSPMFLPCLDTNCRRSPVGQGPNPPSWPPFPYFKRSSEFITLLDSLVIRRLETVQHPLHSLPNQLSINRLHASRALAPTLRFCKQTSHITTRLHCPSLRLTGYRTFLLTPNRARRL